MVGCLFRANLPSGVPEIGSWLESKGQAEAEALLRDAPSLDAVWEDLGLE